jgi:hypothetical protein
MWGGLPRNRCCDMISEKDYQEVFKWWETNTIVSLIQKDVKAHECQGV